MLAQVCKGICEKLKSSTYSDSVRNRYKLGQKYCSECSLFFFTDKFTCSCCKTKLRSKPRSNRHGL